MSLKKYKKMVIYPPQSKYTASDKSKAKDKELMYYQLTWRPKNPPPAGVSEVTWMYNNSGLNSDPAAVAAAQKVIAAAPKTVAQKIVAAPKAAVVAVVTAAKSANTGIAGGINKVEAKTKDVVNAAESKLKDGAATLKAASLKAVGNLKDIPYAPLLPFKATMINALNRQQVAHTGDLYDVSPKFVSAIVQKNHFESASTPFYYEKDFSLENGAKEYVRFLPVEDNRKFSIDEKLVNAASKLIMPVASGPTANAATAAVPELGIIKQVIDYFKKLITTKKDPKAPPLTTEEQKQLVDATIAADAVVAATDTGGISSELVDLTTAVQNNPTLMDGVGESNVFIPTSPNIPIDLNNPTSFKVIDTKKIVSDNSNIAEEIKTFVFSTNGLILLAALFFIYFFFIKK